MSQLRAGSKACREWQAVCGACWRGAWGTGIRGRAGETTNGNQPGQVIGQEQCVFQSDPRDTTARVRACASASGDDRHARESVPFIGGNVGKEGSLGT